MTSLVRSNDGGICIQYFSPRAFSDYLAKKLVQRSKGIFAVTLPIATVYAGLLLYNHVGAVNIDNVMSTSGVRCPLCAMEFLNDLRGTTWSRGLTPPAR